jgi:uncharacterized protein
LGIQFTSEIIMSLLFRGGLITPHRFIAAALAASVSLAYAANTTTLGTRGSLSQANPAVSSNAGSTWFQYDRAEQFPNIATLPLQFITTRSGQKLAVLVTVPADWKGKPVAGQFPAILTQTAYRIDVGQLLGTINTKSNSLLIGGKDAYMIKRGYASVAVDVLGSGMSDGETVLLGEAEQAAYGDAVDWIAQQSWSDGKVGLAGTSYLGITSLLTAQQQKPSVKAVFVQVPMGDAYRGTVGVGGLLNGLFLSKWLPLTQALSVQNALAIQAHPEYAAQIEAANQQHINAIQSWYLPTVDSGMRNVTGIATDDGNFWSLRSPLEGAANIRVPTFIIGANQDIFQRAAPLLYEQLKRNTTTKLLVLKGAHLESVLNAQKDANNDFANGAPQSETIMLQWFDQYLKGMDTRVSSLPNVTQYVQGYGTFLDRFVSTTDWPHPKAKPQRLYLRRNEGLSTQAAWLNETPLTISEPQAPVVTYGISSSGKTVKADVAINDGSDCSSSYIQWTLGLGDLLPKSCYTNSATVERTQKAAIYETERLKEDMYINGPIQADIWISSTKTEAALAIRVDDVDVFGRATPITTGLMSASYRAVDTSRSRYIDGVMMQPWHPFTAASRLAVVPGQPMLVPVEVFPAAAVVRKGHKLRIAISASNQAQGVWSLPMQAKANGNVTSILTSRAHPSSIVLPLVPTSELK